jgi:hypothetical protein
MATNASNAPFGDMKRICMDRKNLALITEIQDRRVSFNGIMEALPKRSTEKIAADVTDSLQSYDTTRLFDVET